ncbi:MAG: PspC domain-containing protein [Bacteroidetes bacterium]|nr:PspC domain-containing protein [Bacteroidota bacterium]
MKDKLHRSRIDRVFGGVASGLAKYLNLDAILVRVVFIILAFINGIGVILYIILWIVLPEDDILYNFASSPSGGTKPDGDSQNAETDKNSSSTKSSFNYQPFPEKKSSGTGRIVVGGIFIVLGFLFLADRIFPYFDFEDFFPILFIIVGVTLLVNSLKK